MGLLSIFRGRKDSLSEKLIDEVSHRDAWWEVRLKELESGLVFLDLPDERKVEVVHEIAQAGLSESPTKPLGGRYSRRWQSVCSLLKAMLRRKLPFQEDQILDFLRLVSGGGSVWVMPGAGVAKALEEFTEVVDPSERIVEIARNWATALDDFGDADCRKLAVKVREAIGAKAGLSLVRGDVWSDQAIRDLRELSDEDAAHWDALLTLCRGASGGKPTAKWKKQVAELIPDRISEEQFATRVLSWFSLVEQPAEEGRVKTQYGHRIEMGPRELHESNQDVLKGLVWVIAGLENRELIRSVSALCISAFKKIPSYGPRATRLGNACVYALGASTSREALAQLAVLKVKIKGKGVQNQIAKALLAAAEREGLDADELEEISVPDYGFTEVGIREETLGEFVARLEITGSTSTLLQWVKSDGKIQKSVPAVVKTDFAEPLKEIRAMAKDVQKMLPAIRERMDGFFLAQKSWPFSTWRERYHDHPVTGFLARRLIWRFAGATGSVNVIFWKDQWVSVEGESIEVDPETTTVTLWHPLHGDIDEALDWRNFLESNEICQPFKQAHREIYLLTDAERTTDTYSNRYAAHVLKQHQFNALCQAKGWRNTLRLMVDDDYPPASRVLGGWGLRAEYWIEGVGDDYQVDTTEAGTFLYLVTDQVRFYPVDAAQVRAHASGGGYGSTWRGGTGDPMRLEDVPPLVFSEIMRDCDLFVGVSSVGNDPNWSDGGPNQRHYDYWQSYAFGELSGTAKSRKEILERLLPRLKISEQARIDGKFLIVDGKIRSYKIHLGSGNILMTPSDQYLCIVPNASNRRGADNVFLPFEGDNTLAIVLSKAFLLADDDKIKDRTILSQIRSKR